MRIFIQGFIIFLQILHASLFVDDDIYLRLQNGARFSLWWCNECLHATDFFYLLFQQCDDINELKLNDVENVILCMRVIANTGK